VSKHSKEKNNMKEQIYAKNNIKEQTADKGNNKKKEKIFNKGKNIINEQVCSKEVFINIIYAIVIMLYFVILNVINYNCTEDIFKKYIKISYMTILIISVITIETAYRKNNKKIAINGIEYIIIATYILLIETITTALSLSMNKYIVFSSYVFPIYYIFKSIIMETTENRKELKQLSDIKDIVKKEKPTKKVAKKRII
jgi:hypothetical protein